jgi:hypothetical protein
MLQDASTLHYAGMLGPGMAGNPASHLQLLMNSFTGC